MITVFKHKEMRLTKSVLFLALFLLQIPLESRGALSLTETINTIPEGEIELSFRAECYRIDETFRIEKFSLGLGILSSLSIWYSFQYLHRGFVKTRENELGDSFFKIWIYLGDYIDDSLHLGLSSSFRLPTGRDVYVNQKWRNLSFGNHELKLGPVIQQDIKENFFIHLNIFYVFREGVDEGFYSGIYINPIEKDTYTRLFGLNYKAENTFLETGRLKNDYIILSFAINTDAFHPLIPSIEYYYSRRLHKRGNTGVDNIPIEGSGINPTLISLGFRYFILEYAFFGFYYIKNTRREEKFVKDAFGLDFSLQF